ncbi:restriction endonuclease subunit S [Clostridium ihumii]|uniref:restriction endonuclease subunit S n=1 Tax=Clostridium ihumii TaxID=1470356 RepID=UPI003D338388
MDMMLEQFKTIFDRPEKVKKLRETILDLAVRGKLVEQNPNDEPASVLLERIREEKERLIREKRIKKEKPLAEISEEEKPFELPYGWELTRIGEIITLKGGKRLPKGYSLLQEETSHVYIRITDMKNGSIKNYDLKYISDEVYEKIKSYIITKDDLYITIAGTIGEVGIVPDKFDNMNLTENAARIIPCKVNKFWLKSFIESTFIQRILLDKVNQMAQPKLALKRIQDTIIPLPPLIEQKRIVEKVNSLMAFCDKLEKALDKKVNYGELAAKSVFNAVGNVSTAEELEETLRFILLNFKDLSLGDNAVKELKNCILQLAVQGKLVPQDPNDEPAEVLLESIREEKERLIKEKKIKKEKPLAEISDNPYIIPSRWSLVRLGTLAKAIEYGTSTKADLDQSKVPVLRMNNIIDGKIDYKNLKYVDSDIKDLPRLYLNNKDLLFNRTNSYELVGKTAVFTGVDSSMTFASYLIRIELFNEMVNADYINIVMNSNLYRISQIEPEITQQNGQANFNGTKLKSTIIPLAPIEEQKRIVEKVDSLMILCDELEKKIQKQKDYSNRLMESILKSSF